MISTSTSTPTTPHIPLLAVNWYVKWPNISANIPCFSECAMKRSQAQSHDGAQHEKEFSSVGVQQVSNLADGFPSGDAPRGLRPGGWAGSGPLPGCHRSNIKLRPHFPTTRRAGEHPVGYYTVVRYLLGGLSTYLAGATHMLRYLPRSQSGLLSRRGIWAEYAYTSI